MRIISLILFFTFTTVSMATKVKVYGTAPSYAGTNLKIRVHAEPFTYTEKEVGGFTVDMQGNFSVELDVEKTQLAFLPLGSYKGFVYLEPGMEYELKLPPKKELSPSQKLNPFFEAEELMLGVANAGTKELNLLIRKLDDRIDSFINRNFDKIYRKKEKSAGIEFAKRLEKVHETVANPFFQDYLFYRLGFLEFLAHAKSFNRLEKKYFANKKTQLDNPAYMSLYKKQYGNFLNGHFSRIEPVAMPDAMKSANSCTRISALMAKYPAYENSQFRNMIIATSAFDSFSKKFISRKKALNILSEIQKTDPVLYNQELCTNFIAKITHLQKNSPAPDFSIGEHKLANYRGKYLYLNFCNTQSPPCQQDFKEIKKLKQQFVEHVEFLSIACDWDEARLQEFLSRRQFDWPFVPIGNQHQLLKNYKAKAFPTYVLINPNGNIEKAPAPGPKENIRLEFIRIARDAVRKAYRK